MIGIPPTTPWMPRERPNPVTAAYLGLGLALRLWRNAPPVADGGTAILVHPLPRRFPRPTQTPYRALFATAARNEAELLTAEAAAATRRARARGLPRRPRLPPAAAVRRVERVRRGREPARSGARRRLPRRTGGAAARPRPGARPRRRARDGARPRRAADRLPRSRRRTSRSPSERKPQLRSRRGRSCGPPRSSSAPPRCRRARCGPSRARSRGRRRRAPSARSARPAGSTFPAR